MYLQVLLQSSALQARRNVFLQVENKLLNLKEILRYMLLHFLIKSKLILIYEMKWYDYVFGHRYYFYTVVVIDCAFLVL